MTDPKLPAADHIDFCKDRLDRTLAQLDRMLLGRHALHRMVLTGILANGHILLEGLPGLGKTALVKALSAIMQLQSNRVQFTPDLMPGDILGAYILETKPDGSREMTFHPGPIFCNILLADEINRASPKTQSAMLESMQERAVTLMGTTRKLPEPFFVLASQNPIELEGTYPLPEAQLDRFLFKLMVDSVDADTLRAIVTTRRQGTTPPPDWQMTADELARIMRTVAEVFIPDSVAEYIGRLVAATHPGAAEAPQLVTDYLSWGASPRAAIGIAEAARALSLIEGRPCVGFDDVRAVAPHVLNHRLILNYKARFEKIGTFAIIDELLRTVTPVKMNLPKGVSVQ